MPHFVKFKTLEFQHRLPSPCPVVFIFSYHGSTMPEIGRNCSSWNLFCQHCCELQWLKNTCMLPQENKPKIGFGSAVLPFYHTLSTLQTGQAPMIGYETQTTHGCEQWTWWIFVWSQGKILNSEIASWPESIIDIEIHRHLRHPPEIATPKLPETKTKNAEEMQQLSPSTHKVHNPNKKIDMIWHVPPQPFTHQRICCLLGDQEFEALLLTSVSFWCFADDILATLRQTFCFRFCEFWSVQQNASKTNTRQVQTQAPQVLELLRVMVHKLAIHLQVAFVLFADHESVGNRPAFRCNFVNGTVCDSNG